MLSIAIRAVLLLLALSHIGPSLAADIADPPGGSGMAAAPWPAWTQFVPGGAVEARAIVPTERRCPTLGVSAQTGRCVTSQPCCGVVANSDLTCAI